MTAIAPLLAPLLLLAFVAWQEKKFERERQAFADEREAWVRERRDLNNRIQIPEAAPFMLEEDTGENDLPLAPEFTVDEEELERAQAELESVGYSDGPAA